jgi:uncharacterized membrane protein
MLLLIAGLVIFIGVHATRIAAEPWRQGVIGRRGEGAWKGIVSVLSFVGLALIVWGYAEARQAPTPLWAYPPVWTRHVAALLTLVAFVLLAAAYVPGNAIQARVGHPMVLGIKVWALAHLIANHTLADLLLFGSLLVWAVLSFRAARARDRAAGTVRTSRGAARTIATVAAGVVAWAVFAFWAHGFLFGVKPFG